MSWLPDNTTHHILDRLRAPMTGLINVLSVAFAIYGTLAAIYIGQLHERDKIDKANLLLTVLVVGLVVWIFFREFNLARKQRYANATHNVYHLSNNFNTLNEYLLESLRKANKGEFVSMKETRTTFANALQGICDETARMFSTVTGTNCRAALKVPAFDGSDPDKYWAVTVARDTNSAASNKQLDKYRADRRLDAITDNEDFFMLFDDTPDTGYYLNNNLQKSFFAGVLKSTSVEVHRQTASARGSPLPMNRYPLPYRSTMVWPVRSEGEDATKPKFHAFLAVDSESRDVFYEVWDSKLGSSIAEQACVSFELFHELLHTLATRTN